MRRAIITLLVLLSFGLKAQVYQAMPQAGYGPVKRMLFDSVLTKRKSMDKNKYRYKSTIK
jgi:hypothetical protein